jgi:hypothetical protein
MQVYSKGKFKAILRTISAKKARFQGFLSRGSQKSVHTGFWQKINLEKIYQELSGIFIGFLIVFERNLQNG